MVLLSLTTITQVGVLLFPFTVEELGTQGHTCSEKSIQIPPKSA